MESCFLRGDYVFFKAVHCRNVSSDLIQAALDVEPVSGSIAYLAGSVVVILDADGHQRHIVNETKKAFTSLAFSNDGKTLLTGKVPKFIKLRCLGRDLWPTPFLSATKLKFRADYDSIPCGVGVVVVGVRVHFKNGITFERFEISA